MNIKKLFFTWQLGIIIITALATVLVPLKSDYLGVSLPLFLSEPLLYSRANFDGFHYLLIASHGYSFGEQVFFPLYPFLISILSFVLKVPSFAGVAISLVSFFVGLIFFFRLINLDYSSVVAKLSVLALLVFPVSFYFGQVYTEGLFFCLIVCAFYAIRTKKYLLASLLGVVAVSTRFVGIFLFPAFIYELMPQKRFSLFFLTLLIPLALASYMFYLHKTTGDPLAFVHMQRNFRDYHSDKIIFLPQVIWRYFKMLTSVKYTNPTYLTLIFEFFVGITFFILSLLSFAKQRTSYSIFSFLTYLLPTLTGSFVSLPRYVLACFPIFILIGKYLANHPRFAKIYFGCNVILFIIYLTLFSRGYWVG